MAEDYGMTHVLASGLVIGSDHLGPPAAWTTVGLYVGVGFFVVYLVVVLLFWRRVVRARRNDPSSPLAHPTYPYVGRAPQVLAAVAVVMAGAIWWVGLQDVRATGPDRWIWPWGEVLMWVHAVAALGVLVFGYWRGSRKARAIASMPPSGQA